MGRDDLVELDPRNYNVPKAVELNEFTAALFRYPVPKLSRK